MSNAIVAIRKRIVGELSITPTQPERVSRMSVLECLKYIDRGVITINEGMDLLAELFDVTVSDVLLRMFRIHQSLSDAPLIDTTVVIDVDCVDDSVHVGIGLLLRILRGLIPGVPCHDVKRAIVNNDVGLGGTLGDDGVYRVGDGATLFSVVVRPAVLSDSGSDCVYTTGTSIPAVYLQSTLGVKGCIGYVLSCESYTGDGDTLYLDVCRYLINDEDTFIQQCIFNLGTDEVSGSNDGEVGNYTVETDTGVVTVMLTSAMLTDKEVNLAVSNDVGSLYYITPIE